jgi:NAD(P)-dependent dehydrogenase (short-subunit alcohol dehydrogenase family)
MNQPSMRQLEGKVAVVTGGTQGLGEAVARLFTKRGAAGLVICGRQADKGEAVASELTAGSCRALFVRADLAEVEEARRVIAAADRAFGRVDVLINAAGITDRGTILDTTPELFDRMMAVNLRAPFFLIRHLAPGLRERRGTVVNLCDLAGLQPWAAYAAHAIAKAGLVHLTKIAARTLAPEVRVNGIAPGAVLPPESMTEDELAALARTTPLRRIGSPDDVVRAVLYLLRADYVTGEILVVDGGRMLRG